MTEPQAPTPAQDETGEAPQKPIERGDLDAEIVRDLEVDERGAEVRGGACPTSRPV